MNSFEYDRSYPEVNDGISYAAHTLMAVEGHGAGRQMIRFRSWPKISPMGYMLTPIFSFLAAMAAIDQSWLVFVILVITTGFIAVRSLGDCAVATASYLNALKQLMIGGT